MLSSCWFLLADATPVSTTRAISAERCDAPATDRQGCPWEHHGNTRAGTGEIWRSRCTNAAVAQSVSQSHTASGGLDYVSHCDSTVWMRDRDHNSVNSREGIVAASFHSVRTDRGVPGEGSDSP